MIRSGADLVYLAEEFYLRLFKLSLCLTVVGAVLSAWFGTLAGSRASSSLSDVFSVLGLAGAAAGLARPPQAYCWLRYSAQHQLVPAGLAALAVLVNGPDSPSWWMALPLLWIVAVVSSTRLALAAAAVTALAYLVGTLIGGEALIHAGDTGVFPATLALLADTLIARLVVETFARFTLRMHQLEQTAASPPLWVPNLASASSSHSQAPKPPPATDPVHPVRSSRLTARQLEVVLLVRDGLRQSEIALCLGISPRQVERHLHDARIRVGAATTSQLAVMLVTGGLVPAT
jgi:DNA-binding CsgD family transcriptional regulator